MRWGRIVAAAVLLEVLLFVVLLPLGAVIGMPGFAGAGSEARDYTPFFVSVAVGCLVFSALLGMWVARPLTSGFALHGLLVGVLATAIYLAICSIPPTTIAKVIAGYGPFWFFMGNGLRIAGATAGALYHGSRRR